MAEHQREERGEQSAVEHSRDEEALEEVEALDEQAREAEEARKARKARMPRLFSSPSERLSVALAAAGVPLIDLLGPHVVNCVWRSDGFFSLELTRAVFIDSGAVTVRFERFVEGRAGYDGLSELMGVQAQTEGLRAPIQAVRGGDDLRTVAIQFAGQASWLVTRTPPTEQADQFDWPELQTSAGQGESAF